MLLAKRLNKTSIACTPLDMLHGRCPGQAGHDGPQWRPSKPQIRFPDVGIDLDLFGLALHQQAAGLQDVGASAISRHSAMRCSIMSTVMPASRIRCTAATTSSSFGMMPWMARPASTNAVASWSDEAIKLCFTPMCRHSRLFRQIFGRVLYRDHG
jgi:hypothetical protein